MLFPIFLSLWVSMYSYFYVASFHSTLVVYRCTKCPKNLAKRINTDVGVSARVEFNISVRRGYVIIIYIWSRAEDIAVV